MVADWRRAVRCRDLAPGEMATSVARNPLNVTVVAPGMNPEPRRRVLAVPLLPGPVVMSRLARSGRCWGWEVDRERRQVHRNGVHASTTVDNPRGHPQPESDQGNHGEYCERLLESQPDPAVPCSTN